MLSFEHKTAVYFLPHFKEFIHIILPTALFVIKSHIPVAFYELLYHKMFHSLKSGFHRLCAGSSIRFTTGMFAISDDKQNLFFIHTFRMFIWFGNVHFFICHRFRCVQEILIIKFINTHLFWILQNVLYNASIISYFIHRHILFVIWWAYENE